MSDYQHPQLAETASQETLQQLDPMPMVDGLTAPAQEQKDSEKARALTSAATTGGLGLGTGHHSTIYSLLRVQRYSSYAFSLFTSVHIATVSLVPLAMRSVPASESYLLLAREIYQTRLSEPLLVALPIVAHVAAGVGLRLARRHQAIKRYGSTADAPPLSFISISGYALASSLAIHVAINRLVPLAVAGDSADVGLAYVAHGFARHPTAAWATYVAFLGAAAGHMVWGWAHWLRVVPRAAWMSRPRSGNTLIVAETQRRSRRNWLGIQGSVLLIFAAWAAGGLGVVARGGRTDGWIGKVYDGLFAAAWL